MRTVWAGLFGCIAVVAVLTDGLHVVFASEATHFRLAALSDKPKSPRPTAPGESCATLRGHTGSELYCASSTLPPQAGNSYGVQNLFSNNTTEAWVEGKPGSGVGEWIVIEFDDIRLVKAVIIRNGYQKTPDIFRRNERVRRLRLVFSEGGTQTLVLPDSYDQQTIALGTPVKARWVQFVIEDVYKGTSYTDTAISKLFLTSEPAE